MANPLHRPQPKVRFISSIFLHRPPFFIVSIGKGKKGEEVKPEKGDIGTSEKIYNRIKWDGSLNADDFVIGYEDRFLGT